MAETVLVSSCLLGLPTRYDGSDNFSQAVADYLQQHQLVPIPVCPEQLAGLPTPRPKCWFRCGDGNDVLNSRGNICDESGNDVTEVFYRAAAESCIIAELTGCKLAILKQRSPSCGSSQIHQNGQLRSGMGVTAARLQKAGLKILSEDDLGLK
ncbi:DUF523 domain-containing protein [Deltaproteobacteria bacterium]|nr:DUF523 domain-containing protein [Deltaproteobacteria bacterium]